MSTRITFAIEDDMFEALSDYARARSLSMGEAAAKLLRSGLIVPPSRSKFDGVDDLPFFRVPRGSRPIAPEDLKQLQDET